MVTDSIVLMECSQLVIPAVTCWTNKFNTTLGLKLSCINPYLAHCFVADREESLSLLIVHSLGSVIDGAVITHRSEVPL